jgi:hypothetical protein
MGPGALNGPESGAVGIIHVHSTYSRDGRDTPEDIRAFACARGIRFVALTDHAEDLTPQIFERFVAHCQAVSDDQVRLLPGLEFRFAGFNGLHLLALGLSRWIVAVTPAAFMAEAPRAAALTIVAHPLLPRYRIPADVANGIDAIEVWNAAYNTRYLPDPRALRLLESIRKRRPEVVGTAGLDQHDARNDRGTRVVLFAPHSDDPLGELRKGRFENRGATLRFASRAPFGPIALVGLGMLRPGRDAANWLHERLHRLRRR